VIILNITKQNMMEDNKIMEIILLTKSPFPYGFAATNRFKAYAKGLMCNGEKCSYHVCFRTEISDYIKNKNVKGLYEGIPFSYIPPTTVRDNNNNNARIVSCFDFLRLAHFIIKKTTNKTVFVLTDIGNLATLLVLLLVHLKGGKMIKEYNEHPYGSVVSRKDKIHAFVILHFIMKFFDGFIVISEALALSAAKYGRKKSKIIKVPILIDKQKLDFYQGVMKENIIFFAGTLSEKKDGILTALKAFSIALPQIKENVKFYLAGPKSLIENKIKELIEKLSLKDNVVLLGELSYDDVLKWQSKAKVSILVKNDNLQNRCGFSTKLGDILYSETAVITNTVGEANYYLKNGESAYIVPPNNVNLISEKIVQAFNNLEERKLIAREGKKIASKYFDANFQGKRMKKYFYDLLNIEDNSSKL